MKRILFAIICVILVFVVLAGLGGQPALTCQFEQTSFPGYDGVGINHTTNVTIRLETPAGRLIVPSESVNETTPEGTPFTAHVYYSGAAPAGDYTIKVFHNGKQLDTIPIMLDGRNSPIVTVVCR